MASRLMSVSLTLVRVTEVFFVLVWDLLALRLWSVRSPFLDIEDPPLG